MELQSDVLQVVGILVAASAFLTGFRSVKLHGHRDRTFERLDRLYERLASGEPGTADAAEASGTPGLVELQSAARDIFRPHRIIMPAVANALLLVIVLVIGVAAIANSDWKLGWPPKPGNWLLASLIGTEVLVVSVMFTDGRRVRSQFVEKWKWLTRSLPWLPGRLAQLEADSVDLILHRLSKSVEGGLLTRHVSQEAARALMSRAKEATRFLGAMQKVYDRRFVVESENLDELRKSVGDLDDLLSWHISTLAWLQQLLKMGKAGGILGPPPERPQNT